MRAPLFWQTSNFFTLIVLPVALLYQIVYIIRCFITKPQSSNSFIVCVGNVTVGGGGKTPFALALGSYLISKNYKIAFLSKGYKSQCKYAKIVDLKEDDAALVGDEPLLLAKNVAPTIIAKDRRKGLKLAESLNPQIIIMDDGFQNPHITKDLSILVFDSNAALGNEMLFPSGPLREPLNIALARSNFNIIIGEDNKILKEKIGNDSKTASFSSPTKPEENIEYLAFAGIASPDKFFSFLKRQGFNIKETSVFADHYLYKDKDIEKLITRAQNKNLQLITTQKDAVKIKSLLLKEIIVVESTIEFNNFAEIEKFINKKTKTSSTNIGS